MITLMEEAITPVILRPLVVRFEQLLPSGDFTLIEAGAEALNRNWLYRDDDTGEMIEVPGDAVLAPMVLAVVEMP